jgi:hypothetical protein
LHVYIHVRSFQKVIKWKTQKIPHCWNNCVRDIVTKPVPSQESEWLCICVLGLSMLYMCLFDTDTLIKIDADTTWITLTHKYTTTHFPGLVQSL